MAIFGFHPVECRLVEQRAAVPGFTFSFMKNQAIGHALGVVFLFMVVGEVQLCT